MKIVKLDAIDSTNSYLKNIVKEKDIDNWTVVTAKHQTHGKGQFDNQWNSERDKNLIFSILVRFDNLKIENQFYLNYCVSLALYNVLKYYIPEKLTVKWPNDILSANHKICGILIESTVNQAMVNHAIIGVGLNVNQEQFIPYIANASSLKMIMNKAIDKDELLDKILLEIQYQMLFIKRQKFAQIKSQYEAVLYKKGIPSMFIDSSENTFLGKIVGISKSGKLRVEHQDESVKEYDLKEIRFKNIS